MNDNNEIKEMYPVPKTAITTTNDDDKDNSNSEDDDANTVSSSSPSSFLSSSTDSLIRNRWPSSKSVHVVVFCLGDLRVSDNGNGMIQAVAIVSNGWRFVLFWHDTLCINIEL